MLQVSENKYTWLPMPQWVRFLLDYGYYWPPHDPNKRKITFISMPCDSIAAGLITLGNMRRLLEETDANDMNCHFQKILSTQNSLYKGKEANYRFTGKKSIENINGEKIFCYWVKNSKKGAREVIHSQNAFLWNISGEPPVQIQTGERIENISFYNELFESGVIHTNNLSKSYSSLCLAGRIHGKQETWSMMKNFRFKTSLDLVTSLDTLLTVFDWNKSHISRVLFYNSRTDLFDRTPLALKLIVADGFDALNRLFSKEEAKGSDIICVFNRLQERYKLTNISEFIHSLLERFERKTLFSAPPPRGILTLTLERRQKR